MTTVPSPGSLPLLEELEWRGLLFQQTEGAAAALAKGPVKGYCGFDPTAESLHVGNLVSIMGLVRLARAGHTAVALVGGGTAMIGDPSGKSEERPIRAAEEIAANARLIETQIRRVISNALGGSDAGDRVVFRNNADWLGALGLIPFLRDTGKHFTVNWMMQKDSVKSRMDAGISFTEFSYMLLQAHDFLHLFQQDGVTLQLGGSDQFGNITAGTELIRRAANATLTERDDTLDLDQIVMWFDRGQALQVSDEASAAIARAGFATVPGLIDQVTAAAFGVNDDADAVVACELVLEALVARRKLSRSEGGQYGRAPRRKQSQQERDE